MRQVTENGNDQSVFDGMPTSTKGYAIARGGFSSPEAMVAWLNGPEAANQWTEIGRKNDGADQSFFGNVSYKQACDMVLNGWADGARKAEAIRDKINANNPTGPRMVKYDVAGALPNVARACAGNPMNMRRYDSAKLRKRPVITLVSHYGANASVDASNMLRRAAVVAAVVDAIELAGYSVRLIAFCVSDDEDEKLSAETAITMKEAGQHMDLARVAFGLGHPAMLRRLTFAWRCSTAMLKPMGSSLGRTKYDGLSVTEPGSYLIPAIAKLGESHFATDAIAADAGLRAIIGDLKRQGCPAFTEEG